MSAPLVSIVTATYNRSAVLALALDTVQRQTVTEWEQWVIGDACTDDSEVVVAGLGDPRVHWFNLPVNCGEQSGPNNEGVRRARGRYLAFLNHDDMWFADHLERCVAALEGSSEVDGVFSLAMMLDARGSPGTRVVPEGSGYEPHLSVPASCWVLRRAAAERVGPWRFYRDCWGVPSQDWLRRAQHAGLTMRFVGELTVVQMPSGVHAGVYLRQQSPELVKLHHSVTADPDYRTRLALDSLVRYAGRAEAPRSWRANARRLLRDAVKRTVLRAGWSPAQAYELARYSRRGGSIDALRARRGLPPK